MCEERQVKRDKRNIMILFLSNFNFYRYSKDILDEDGKPVLDQDGKVKKEGRKCLRSPERYRVTSLSAAGDERPWVECIQTNEAPIKDVLMTLGGKPLDAIFCLVSDKVGGRTKESSNVVVWKAKGSDEYQNYKSEMDLFLKERLPSINEDPKLKEVLQKPLTEDIFKEVRFHEYTDDPSEESIQATLELESAIKHYMKNETDDEGNSLSIKDCYIYADITGGKRTANMAISATMQLLQYDGAHLERIVYSDFDQFRPAKENEEKPIHPVSNVQPINDLYKLVAGVDAFTKYGSSAALDEYFEDIKKDCAPLQTLLDAMNAFSESVLLCQPNDIVDNLKKLVPKLEKFKENLGEEQKLPTKAALFERMIDELKDIYLPMYPKEKTDGSEREVDRLEIIQWCVDNSLLQQAVTFCTEWLPEYLVDWGAVYSDDKAVQQYCAKELTDYRTWKKNLLMQFCTLKVYKPDKEGKSILDKITDIAVRKEVPRKIRSLIAQEALRQNLGIDFDEGDVPTSDRWDENLTVIISRLKHFLRSLTKNLERLKNPQGANMKLIMDKTKSERKLLKRIYKKTWDVLVNEKPLTELTISIFQNMYKWNLRAFESFFGITDSEYKYKGNYDYSQNAEDDYRIEEYCLHRRMKDKTMNAAAISHAMFDCGILKTDLTRKDEALHFILHYSYIRTELRNKMNHSSEDNEKKKGKKQDGELQNDMEAMSDNRVIKEEKTQEDYIPMKIQSIKKYLAGYLGEVKHLRDVLQSRRYFSVKEASK